jgi:hypothetical protein
MLGFMFSRKNDLQVHFDTRTGILLITALPSQANH